MLTKKTMTLDDVRKSFSNGDQVAALLEMSPTGTLLAPMDEADPSSTRYVLVYDPDKGEAVALHYNYWDYDITSWESLGLEMLVTINNKGDLPNHPLLQQKAVWGEAMWRRAEAENRFVDEATGKHVMMMRAPMCQDMKDIVVIDSAEVVNHLAGLLELGTIEVLGLILV